MAESFSAQMKSFANMTEDKALKVFKRTCLDIASSVIKDTPVDTGRARLNWQPEINTFPTTVLLGEDKSATRGKERIRENNQALKLGDTFTLTNNLDYIETLEYGLYPNPVKLGTRTDEAKGKNNPIKYKILSSGGFSAKSPSGMVRVNLIRFQSVLNIANKEIK